MTRFSAMSLFAKALGNHKTWPELWPDAQPKASYDAIIVGAGGRGVYVAQDAVAGELRGNTFSTCMAGDVKVDATAPPAAA